MTTTSDVDLERIRRVSAELLRIPEASSEFDLREIHTPGYTSRRFVLRRAPGEPDWFIKLFRIPEYTEAQLRAAVRREFVGLRILSRQLERFPGYHAPRPIHHSLTDSLVVMEFVPGTDLPTLLGHAMTLTGRQRAGSTVPRAFADAGRLLYLFQSISFRYHATPNPRTRAIHTEYRSLFDESLSQCLERGGEPTLLRDLADRTRADLAHNFAADIPVTYQHHDYRPQNLLIGDRIALVDFMAFRHGSPYFDLAAFISWLRYLGVRRPWWIKTTDELERVFLAAYLETWDRATPFSADTLDLYIRVLFPWNYRQMLGGTGSGPVGRVRRAWLDHILSRQLEPRAPLV